MGLETFELESLIAASPEAVYRAWTDAAEHSAFTGGAATMDARVGGRFSAWDQYITGENLEIEPGRRLLQSWRTTEFPEGAEASRLEIRFEPEGSGTRVRLAHSQIPEGQGERYRKGWQEHYFTPLAEHFAKKAASEHVKEPNAPAANDNIGKIRFKNIAFVSREVQEASHAAEAARVKAEQSVAAPEPSAAPPASDTNRKLKNIAFVPRAVQDASRALEKRAAASVGKTKPARQPAKKVSAGKVAAKKTPAKKKTPVKKVAPKPAKKKTAGVRSAKSSASRGKKAPARNHRGSLKRK